MQSQYSPMRLILLTLVLVSFAFSQESPLLLGATVYDFSKRHPDFMGNEGSFGKTLHLGMVQNKIDLATRKPLKNDQISFFDSDFEHWFTPVTTGPDSMRNNPTCLDLALTKLPSGSYKYQNNLFFPIDTLPLFDAKDGTEKGADDKQHNFKFCMEIHNELTYRKGQIFNFQGDDDVWVFINDSLVIDLGGTHSAVADSVSLDDLGLEDGHKYPFDFFYCERKASSSNLELTTSIEFTPRWSLLRNQLTALLPWQSYEYISASTGQGLDCKFQTIADSVFSTMQVSLGGGALSGMQILSGANPMTGIRIDSAKGRISIDTTNLGLPEGDYFLLIQDANTGKMDTLHFVVPALNATNLPTIPVTDPTGDPVTPAVVVPPIPLPELSHAVVKDTNGDGRADLLVLQWTKPFTDWEVLRWGFSWSADTLATPLSLDHSGKELAWSDGLDSMFYGGALANTVRTSGSAILKISIAKGLFLDTLEFPVSEEIAAVILNAEIHEQDSTVLLILGMSEAIHPSMAGLYPEHDGFLFKNRSLFYQWGQVLGQSLELSDDGNTVIVHYSAETAVIPVGGDSVTLAPGILADLQGNVPGVRSLAVPIRGARPTKLSSNSFLEARTDNAGSDPFHLEAVANGSNVKEIARSSGTLGVLVEMDFPGMISILDTVAGDSAKIPDLRMTMQLQIYDQYGQFVHQKMWTMNCSDTIFGEDCRHFNQSLFLGWSGLSQSGRRAGTGVYIARMIFRVESASKLLARKEKVYRWGLRRGKGK